jgi:hypothetical protein
MEETMTKLTAVLLLLLAAAISSHCDYCDPGNGGNDPTTLAATSFEASEDALPAS